MDPKGSPDGTKIHYHSTRDIENLAMAWTRKYNPKRPTVLPVRSTKGFPESGDLAFRNEVIGYKSKTPTAFVGIERRKYNTLPVKVFGLPGRRVFPPSAYLLDAEDRQRSPGLRKIRSKFGKDHPLIYQRQTDCYIVVVRKPDAPHLRVKDGRVEIIPGEDHCETYAYRLRAIGGASWERTVRPGETFRLPRAGRYAATAVEWCGLESPLSPPLTVNRGVEGRVCRDTPGDFRWTRDVWRVNGRIVSRQEALKAAEATREGVHLHDGVIARETWKGGSKASRVALNADGRPIRRLYYADGRRVKRSYMNPDGQLVSDELYGPDGFKTEYLRYSWKPGVKAVARHWWYDRGKPAKKTAGKRVVFDFTAKSGAPGARTK